MEIINQNQKITTKAQKELSVKKTEPAKTTKPVKKTSDGGDNSTSKKKTKNISNRGTGAGGKNTNKNGLTFEKKVSVISEIDIHSSNKKGRYFEFGFKNDKDENYKYIAASQNGFFKYMDGKGEINNDIKPAHGCKKPDECIIDEDNKKIYIVEKKFQQVSGSVCEKIQTAPFKKEHYQKRIPNYKIHYIYCLSKWFEKNCETELEYLKENGIPVFIDNKKIGEDIKNFIIKNRKSSDGGDN
jgi:hypothetical protein